MTHWHRISPYATGIVCPIAVTACSAIAGATHGLAQVLWGAGAAVATAIAAGYAVRAEMKARTNALTSHDELASRLHHAAEPLLATLGWVTSAKTAHDRRVALKVLLENATDVARSLTGHPERPPHLRSAFYQLIDDRLVRQHYRGWQGSAPRRDFQRGRSAHDDEAVACAIGESAVVVNDLREAAPASFADPEGRSYRSFVAVPVRAGETSFGMLTIDSDQPGTFTEVEKGHVILIAGVLGAALAHGATVEAARPLPILRMAAPPAGR